MDKRKIRSRKRKTLRLKGLAAIGGGTVAAVALITAFVYAQVGRQYKKVFFPNTTINGMDVSRKSIEEVEKMFASGMEGYTLKVKERGGKTEEIKGSEIGLKLVFDGSLEELLAKQEPINWLRHEKEPQSFEIHTMIQYEKNQFHQAVSGLTCFKEDQMEKPENAYLSDYVSGKGFHIISAKEGTLLEPEKVTNSISEAVTSLKPEISLEEAYVRPQVLNDNPRLTKQMQSLNTYTSTTITYTFGKEKKVLNGDTISKWVGVNKEGEAYLDSSKVSEYVKALASSYDTYNQAKTLKTSYGQTVKITGGIYGWRMNQSAEANELAELIRTGQSQTREPIYIQKGASHGTTDYGDTYVEVNLTAQHLFVYKDGKRLLESDFVSGNQSKGWSTPTGVYSLTYKQKNAVLKGENYSTPVSFWMPFNGNIGFHDASWRSTFGGTIYEKHGSHGCVNLPPAFAKLLFNDINTGIPVLCYRLAGTESKDITNSAAESKETTVKETTVKETPPEETTIEETTTAASATTQETVAPTTVEETTTQEPAQSSAPDSVAGPTVTKGAKKSDSSSESGEVGPGVMN